MALPDPRIDWAAIKAHYAPMLAVDPASVPVPGWPETPDAWWSQIEAASTNRSEFPRPEGGMAVSWDMARIDDSTLYALLMNCSVTNCGGGAFIGWGTWEELRARFSARYLAWRAERHEKAVRRARTEASRRYEEAVEAHVVGGWHLAEGGAQLCGEAGGDGETGDIALVTCLRCLDRLGATGRIVDLVRVPIRKRQDAAPRAEPPRDYGWDSPAGMRTENQWREGGRRLKRNAQPAGTMRWVPPWNRRAQTLKLYAEEDTEPMYEILERSKANMADVPPDAPDLSDFIKGLVA